MLQTKNIKGKKNKEKEKTYYFYLMKKDVKI